MTARSKYRLVLALLLLSLATALAGLVLGELRASLGAVSSLALTRISFPTTAERAWRFLVATYVAFATWATKACFVSTVGVASSLFLGGWLLDESQLLHLGLRALVQGLAANLLIALSLAFPGGTRYGKAPQGLPEAEEAQREATALLLAEWQRQGSP